MIPFLFIFRLIIIGLCPVVLHVRYHLFLFFYKILLYLGKREPIAFLCLPPWPRGYKTFFSYSTQLSTKFILLINVKMPTIVGILTFRSMINATAERLKARNFFICRNFSNRCDYHFMSLFLECSGLVCNV